MELRAGQGEEMLEDLLYVFSNKGVHAQGRELRESETLVATRRGERGMLLRA